MKEDIFRAQTTLLVWESRIRASKLDSHIKSFRQVWRTHLRLCPPPGRLLFLSKDPLQLNEVLSCDQ